MTPNPYEPRLVRSLDSYLQHGHAASAGRACGADKAFSDFHPLSPGTVKVLRGKGRWTYLYQVTLVRAEASFCFGAFGHARQS